MIYLGVDDTLVGRMPTPAERVELGITEGVPVIAVQRAGGEVDLYPWDEFEIGVSAD